MIRPVLLGFASVISLSACAANAALRPSSTFIAARLLADSSAVAPISGARWAGPAKLPSSTPIGDVSTGAPISRVEAANRAALQEPSSDSYLGALQVYPWVEGGLYRLYTAPERVSDIALEPGEKLVSVAAGDTARWVIGDTTSGSGPTLRTHILVKPFTAGLRTNLVIATDRRAYHVELESNPKASMASIAWSYPADPLVALRGSPAGEKPVATGVQLEALNFDYRIDGDSPSWRPLRAFDDGHQVFIEFPPSLIEGEAPPLFVTGDGGRPALVNYRVRGRYYVVDHLFAAAELRLGGRHQQVVRIVRNEPRPGRSGS